MQASSPRPFAPSFCTLRRPLRAALAQAGELLLRSWLVGHPSHVGNNFLRSVMSVRDL